MIGSPPEEGRHQEVEPTVAVGCTTGTDASPSIRLPPSGSASSRCHEHDFSNDRDYESRCMEWQRRLRLGVVPATKVKDARDDFQPCEKGDCNYANNSPCPDQYERQTLQNGWWCFQLKTK